MVIEHSRLSQPQGHSVGRWSVGGLPSRRRFPDADQTALSLKQSSPKTNKTILFGGAFPCEKTMKITFLVRKQNSRMILPADFQAYSKIINTKFYQGTQNYKGFVRMKSYLLSFCWYGNILTSEMPEIVCMSKLWQLRWETKTPGPPGT